MNCPTCVDTQLVLADRQGIEIDYCPKCRGVWLDRGELDKIIERSAQYSPPASAEPRSTPYADRYQDRDRQRHDEHYHKRKSFWHEIFD